MKYIILFVVIQTSLNSLYSQKIQLDSAFGTNGIVNFNTHSGFGYLEVNTNNEPIVLNANGFIDSNTINYLDIYGALTTNLIHNPVVLVPPIPIHGYYPRLDIDSDNNIYYLNYMLGKDRKNYYQILRIHENSEIDTFNKGIGILTECFNFSLQDFKRQNDGNYILSGNNDSNISFVKINELGVIDSTFRNNFISSIQILASGRIAKFDSDGDNIYGVLHLENSISLLKLKYNGLIDTNFGSNGIVNLFSFSPLMTQQYQVRNIKILHDSSIIVSFSNELIPKSTYIYKITKNGLIDSNFGVNGSIFNYNSSSNQCITIDKNDNIYTNISYPNGNKILKYSKNGNIDTDFEKLNPEFYPINIDNIIYSDPLTLYTIGTDLNTITLAKFKLKSVVNTDVTNLDQSLYIYPNPAQENITLNFRESLIHNANLKIINASAQVMESTIIPAGSFEYLSNTTRWKSGIYFYTISFSDGKTATGNFVID
ncbi:MAG: T9SS type A sorting domain-containing protein [Saprospiraceae bacterium]|nr:T9SS type A sorting domain-containing protein [Candidatus Defluviibacterium haderslevense]MBK7243570.1 T9SS type A sorting domain-containing protein [Candidatus Defluviibacterium haderslevense]